MGAAYGRRHDFSGDVKVPDRSAAACGELRHSLRQIIQILEGHSLEPESARDAQVDVPLASTFMLSTYQGRERSLC